MLLKLVFQTEYTFGEVLSLINIIVLTFCILLFLHHNIFLLLSFFLKAKKYKDTNVYHNYAYVICARNEEDVVGYLIKSINEQDYPKEKMHIFVIADNCTDKTKEVSEAQGATVYERFNTELIGKSYALDEGLTYIINNYKDIEAFIIFDADNLVDKNFTKEINKAYDEGNSIITGFRNSKNYGETWVSSGAGMLYYRELVTMHRVRSAFNISTYVSGTGFLVDKQIINGNNGWIHHRLVEDIEFSISEVLKGNHIAYAENAEFFDEHPQKLSISIKQRLRWCKGTHQCFTGYEGKLIKNFFKTGDFSNIDLAVHIFPAPMISFIWLVILPIAYGIYSIIEKVPFDIYYAAALKPLIDCIIGSYIYCFIVALMITIVTWKRILSKWTKKIGHCFTFPIYMLTYLPITTIAAFKKVKWVPIKHSYKATIEAIKNINKQSSN